MDVQRFINEQFEGFHRVLEQRTATFHLPRGQNEVVRIEGLRVATYLAYLAAGDGVLQALVSYYWSDTGEYKISLISINPVSRTLLCSLHDAPDIGGALGAVELALRMFDSVEELEAGAETRIHDFFAPLGCWELPCYDDERIRAAVESLVGSCSEPVPSQRR